jgi:pilus assembly protein Flp/PilA
MNTMLLKMYAKFQELSSREEGQDLVEYALVLSLVAVAIIASLKTVTTAITAVFSTINASL